MLQMSGDSRIAQAEAYLAWSPIVVINVIESPSQVPKPFCGERQTARKGSAFLALSECNVALAVSLAALMPFMGAMHI